MTPRWPRGSYVIEQVRGSTRVSVSLGSGWHLAATAGSPLGQRARQILAAATSMAGSGPLGGVLGRSCDLGPSLGRPLKFGVMG